MKHGQESILKLQNPLPVGLGYLRHANEYLLKTSIDANGNETDYEYNTNDLLVKVISPPDGVGGTRPEQVFT